MVELEEAIDRVIGGPERKNRVMSEAERDYILRTIRDEQFREYVFALLDSGCRPGELKPPGQSRPRRHQRSGIDPISCHHGQGHRIGQ